MSLEIWLIFLYLENHIGLFHLKSKHPQIQDFGIQTKINVFKSFQIQTKSNSLCQKAMEDFGIPTTTKTHNISSSTLQYLTLLLSPPSPLPISYLPPRLSGNQIHVSQHLSQSSHPYLCHPFHPTP